MPEDSLTFVEGNEVPDLEEAREDQTPTDKWEPSDEDKNGLPSEKDCMEILSNRIEMQMAPAAAEFHTEWDDAKEIYEAYVKPEPNRPNLKAPLSHMVIDAAMAEEIDAFSDVEIDTQNDDDKNKLPILNAAKKYAMSMAGWDAVKIDARRISRIYGFCPVRVSYIREVRKIRERIPVKSKDGGWGISYKEKWDYPWDDVKFEVIDNPRRFLIDNRARHIQDAEDCALTTTVGWNSFRQKVQHNRFYYNLDKVKPGRVDNTTTGMSNNGRAVFPEQDSNVSEIDDVELLEYWNKFLDLYIVWANGIIIRISAIPDDHKELPFAVIHLHPRPHSFYSKGIPKLIESIEAAYNKILNATIQACGLAFPIVTTSEDSGIDPRSVAAYPGVVLDGAMGKMKLEQLGSIPAEVFKTKEELEKLLIWVTGVNYQQIFGELSDRVGIEALKKESMLARVNANLRENESNFVVRLGNLLIQDIMQYYPVKKIRALLASDDLESIPKEDQVITDDGEVRGILETRKIPVSGWVKYDETKTGDSYTLTPMLSEKEGSFIMARPEYIRARGKLDVRAIRPSAMGSSREAKKLMLSELINTAMQVNTQAMQSPVTGPDGKQMPGKPVWDIRYLSKTLAEAMELPIDKAILSGEDNKGKEAVASMQDLMTKLNAGYSKPLEFQLEEQGITKQSLASGQPPAMPNGDPSGGQVPQDQQNQATLSPEQQGAYNANL